MPPTKKAPIHSSKTNAIKRKTDSALTKPGPSKISRQTLDSFFAPRISVSSGNKKEVNFVTLNDEQKSIIRMVVQEGKNVFFTGSAGTGKSLLLRALVTALRKKYAGNPAAVSVTASTGMAASNIGGMTLHAWGAITPNSSNVDGLVRYIKKCKPALQRWKKTEVLILDEVSMVDGHFFDMIASIACELRMRTDKPFGGIQLVITGDFFQLPPVTKGAPFFAFESKAWKSCIQNTVNLKQVFRQKDHKFVDLLNEMRLGTLSPTSISVFKSLSRTIPPGPLFIDPTELFPLRTEVTSSNLARLSALTTPLQIFKSHDTGSATPELKKKLLDAMMAVQEVYLKEGAQVMLIKNLAQGLSASTASLGAKISVGTSLVNGSVGVVIGFRRLVDVSGDTTSSSAVSGTGHVRNVKLGDSSVLSPAATISDDKENKGDEVKLLTENKAPGNRKHTSNEVFPLVRFPTVQGSETLLLMREEFRSEDSDGKLIARRMQIPLILAWAMSIHKSQGQTIHRVKVDLGKVFEKGQSYVALSRASSMDGLQILGFDAKKVMAHPKVLEWNKTLEEVRSPSSDAVEIYGK